MTLWEWWRLRAARRWARDRESRPVSATDDVMFQCRCGWSESGLESLIDAREHSREDGHAAYLLARSRRT